MVYTQIYKTVKKYIIQNISISGGNTPATPIECFVNGIKHARVHHFMFDYRSLGIFRNFENTINPYNCTDLQSERQVTIFEVTKDILDSKKFHDIGLSSIHTHICMWNKRIILIGGTTINSKQWEYILNQESKYFYYTKRIIPFPTCMEKEYLWDDRIIDGHNVKLFIEKIK